MPARRCTGDTDHMHPLTGSTPYPREDTAPPAASWSGRHVCTIDGKRLGKVGECNGHYFRVRRNLLSDFWLPNVLVRGENDEGLRLHIAKGFVQRYAMNSLPAANSFGTEPAVSQRLPASVAE